MIVATSLCKGFGAGTGGAIVLPNPELKRRLIMGVSPLMFSGGMGCGTMGNKYTLPFPFLCDLLAGLAGKVQF